MTRLAFLAELVVLGVFVLAYGLASGGDALTKPAAPLAGEKPRELKLADGVVMKFALIPAGKFMMGSPDNEKGHEADESPQHEVMISKPFYMGIYEVTQEQYEAVIGRNPSKFLGVKNPVEQVSWDDAVAFCKKLSAKSGKAVRLPTEAEWEYACRGRSKTRFYFGEDDDDLGDYAWYDKNSGGKPHPVGQKKPNAFGLYDMHGNVWEWCNDWHATDYYARAKDSDPAGPGSGSNRVMRGGSWYCSPSRCRAACRDGHIPEYRDIDFGFRVVVVSTVDLK